MLKVESLKANDMKKILLSIFALFIDETEALKAYGFLKSKVQ